MNKLEQLVKGYFPGGADALIVTSPISRKYLLDFMSSAGTIVILPDKQYFIVDFRYFEVAKEHIQTCELILQDQLYQQIQEILEKHHVKTVGLEEAFVTLADFRGFRERLESFEVLLDSGLSRLLEKMRLTKTQDEVAKIIKAQEMTDAAFSKILGFIKAGVSEKDVATELEYEMKKSGADGFAFDTISVAGTNSSLPHGRPSDYKLQQGDFLTMDFGAKYDGYHADMTRTVAVGAVSEEQKKVYQTVLTAQQMALDAIMPGKKCSDIDRAARDYIYENGYEGRFGHGLGHSVGLEIHEEPRFSPYCDTVLEPGMVLTVEPGIYLPKQFGVRIEDIVVLTEDGYQNITKSDKNLTCL